jgi:hypothetical protein
MFCLLATIVIASALANAQSPSTYNINLSLAEQSQDDQGRTVVTMISKGDLPGVLTLALSMASDGTVTGGEWSLVVSYTDIVNPQGQTEEEKGETLIQKGVLSGTVLAGGTTLNNGVVSAIGYLQLDLSHGTVEYASVPNGSGSASGTSIDDRANSAGSATLTF